MLDVNCEQHQIGNFNFFWLKYWGMKTFCKFLCSCTMKKIPHLKENSSNSHENIVKLLNNTILSLKHQTISTWKIIPFHLKISFTKTTYLEESSVPYMYMNWIKEVTCIIHKKINEIVISQWIAFQHPTSMKLHFRTTFIIRIIPPTNIRKKKAKETAT